MQTHVIMTVVSDDKPGVVEAIAKVVSDQQGNWLESRLAQLAGKFAGVVRISISPEQLPVLNEALSSLSSEGIFVRAEEDQASKETSKETPRAHFHALGADRAGIVREISQAFANKHINVIELETKLSSMPYSGDPLFEATGFIAIPDPVDIQDVQDELDDIADALALDISVKSSEAL